jgi:hypothetical protein
MAVDHPQGENSNKYLSEVIVAAGGNSSAARRLRVKSQLRDRFGRWVEMGRDCKIKVRFGGKVINVIGKFVGGSPNKPGYGMFLVKNDPNGIQDGVYHFKGKALNEILASIDTDYLKSKNIKLGQDVNGNLIGDVADADIEDISKIQRDEIGSLDEALAEGKIEALEDADKDLVRIEAPKHESHNVVAKLEDATSEDVVKGKSLIEEAIRSKRQIAQLPSGSDEEFPSESSRQDVLDGLELLETSPDLGEAYGSQDSLSKKVSRIRKIKDEWEQRRAFRDLVNDVYLKASSRYNSQYHDDFDESDEKIALDKINAAVPKSDLERRMEAWRQDPNHFELLRNKEFFDLYKKARNSKDTKSAEDNIARLEVAYEKLKANRPVAQLPSGSDEEFPVTKKPTLPAGQLEEAKRLLEQNPSNADSLRETIRFMERNGYTEESDRDVIEAARRELESGATPTNAKGSVSAESLEKFVKDNGGYQGAAEKLLEQNPSNADSLRETIAFIKRNGYADESDRQEISDAFRELNRKPSVDAVTKKILDATGIDLSQSSNDETHAQAKDTLLHVSDLIEKASQDGSVDSSELYDRLADSLIKHFENKANGVAGGRSKFAGKADTIQKVTERKEGTTIDPFSLAQNRKGIAVALDGRNEETIDTVFFDEKLGNLLLADYIDKNMDKFDGNFKLGTWHDKDNNEVTLDVIELFPEAKRDEAIAAGQTRNQQGIFKLSNKEYIDTGGTGDRGRARREREQSRGESSLRPTDKQRGVESPISGREDGESFPTERANLSGTPELDAFESRDFGNLDSRGTDGFIPEYDNYVQTGDREKDGLALISISMDKILDDLDGVEDSKKEEYRKRFEFIQEKLASGNSDSVDEAIDELQKLSLETLNSAYADGEERFDYSPASELSRSLYWWARSVSNEAYPSEVYQGVRSLLPELKGITKRIRPSDESRQVDSLLEDVIKSDEKPGNAGVYNKDAVLNSLRNLSNKLHELYYRSQHSENDDSFDDEEWADLKPFRDRIDRFVDSAKNVYNNHKKRLPGILATPTVAPQIGDDVKFRSQLAENLPRVKSDNFCLDTLGSDELSRRLDNINNSENSDDASNLIGDLLTSLRLKSGSDDLDSDAVRELQSVVNRNKKFKRSYRPNRAENGEFPDENFPENPGSDENENKEPESDADSIVNGVDNVEEVSNSDFYKQIELEKVAAITLNTRTIDRSKMTERQKKILATMVRNRNKAIKAMEQNLKNRGKYSRNSLGTDDEAQIRAAYENSYNYVLATTQAIKRFAGGVEQHGADYNFGSGEEDRVKNFLILENSIETKIGNDGRRIVKSMHAYYTSKSGKTYFMKYGTDYSGSKCYTINADGSIGDVAGYVTLNYSGEMARGPEFEPSVTPSYLRTSPRYRADGIGAANITLARLGCEMSGRHLAHSAALTNDGANNSKGIDRNDPDRHHMGQAEKVLHMMGAPAIELMKRVGWFEDTYRYKNSSYGVGLSFKNFLRPISTDQRTQIGSGDMIGHLHIIDQDFVSIANIAKRRQTQTPDKEAVAGVDYPAFLEEHMKSAKGNYSSFSVRTLLTEMSYKDGISKEEGIKRLKAMQKDLSVAYPQPKPGEQEDYATQEVRIKYESTQQAIKQLIDGLEQWDGFDEARIDRPKPLPSSEFRKYKQKSSAADFDSKKIDFGLGSEEINDYQNPSTRHLSSNSYFDAFGEYPPDNWTNNPTLLAQRNTSDELKTALRDAILGDKLMKATPGASAVEGWGVKLDHSREYAENPSYGFNSVKNVLNALHLQGVDVDSFLAELADEKNGNTDVSEALAEANTPKANMMREIDSVLAQLKIGGEVLAKRSRISNMPANKYDPETKTVSSTRADEYAGYAWAAAARTAQPEGTFSQLIANDKFDYSDGREDVLGAPPVMDNYFQSDDYLKFDENPGSTANPAYIAKNFDKDDLKNAFADSIRDERDSVTLRFSSGVVRDIPLASIRDALQYKGVDTNGLAREVISNKVDRSVMDEKLKAEGRIVPRTPQEVVDHANTVIDLNGMTRVPMYLGGINSPSVFEDPNTGKRYVVKRIDSDNDADRDNRAVDQELATQAFYRAIGINASAPCRGTLNGEDNYVVAEWTEGHPTLEYSDELFYGNAGQVVRNGIIADLFLDQVDGGFNTGNIIIDENGHLMRIDGGGGLLWDPIPSEGLKSETDRFAAGQFPNGATPEQQRVWRDCRRDGPFINNGIEFGLDYYLNKEGWHWNSGGMQARNSVLDGGTDEEYREQARRYLLETMTPDKIDKISRIIRDPIDRAIVAETLNHRRSKILEHFGIEDTYNPDEQRLLNNVPYKHQLDEFLIALDESPLSMDERVELGLKVAQPDMTAGKLSGIIQDLKKLREEKGKESVDTLRENALQEREQSAKDLTPDTSGFPTNGVSDSKYEESEVPDVVIITDKKVDKVSYGDLLLDEKDNPIGHVIIKQRRPDGKQYVGLIDKDRNYVEKIYDNNDSVKVDIGTKGGAVPESQVPPNGMPNTPERMRFVNRLRSRSNLVLQEIKSKYPGCSTLPNGDLVISSSTRTEATRLRRTFRYDVVVHRLPNEKFVSYVRRTQVDERGNQIGEVTVGRISKETHSARHLNNRITPLLGGGRWKGINAEYPQNWFNNSPDLQREVIHPGTKQPIPASLAPENLNETYVGNTGIVSTGDPIKDALISHVADLIDRNTSVSDVMKRLNSQTVLTPSQVYDVAERIQANRQFPGVNQIPYVSRDGQNIVRPGDRVRHYHPDGTIREGRVISREPLMVNKRAQGEYGYTDVLRVTFDDGTRSPIVAKNLEIIRRADGSSPEIKTPTKEDSLFEEPVGLPSGFAVRDAGSIRVVKHAQDPISHSQGRIVTTTDAYGRKQYYAMVWGRGQSPDRNLSDGSVRVNDKNVAQQWMVAKMNDLEDKYSTSDNQVAPSDSSTKTPSKPSNPRAIQNLDRKQGEDFEENKPYSPIEQINNATYKVSTNDKGETEISLSGVEDEKGNSLDANQPVSIITKDKKGKDVIVTYPDAENAAKRTNGIVTKIRKDASQETRVQRAKEKLKDWAEYNATGPHEVLGYAVNYPDFLNLMSSPVSSKYFRRPVGGQSIITPEREAEYERILSRMIPDSVKPNKSGKPRIFFTGGGPGAGKSSLSGKNARGKKRDDDPKGFERPIVPLTVEWEVDGSQKPFDGEPEAVMINPDDLKVQLPEAQASMLRMTLNESDPNVSLEKGDQNWAGAIHEESSILAKILTARAMERKLDIVYDGTGDNGVKSMKGKVKAAKANDYTTIGIYLNAPAVDAIAGATVRGLDTFRTIKKNIQTGTFMSLATMLSKRDFSGKPQESILDGVFDEFYLYDRREFGTPPFLVGTSKKGEEFQVNGQEGNLVLEKLRSELQPIDDQSDKEHPMHPDNIHKRLDEQSKALVREAVKKREREQTANRISGKKPQGDSFAEKKISRMQLVNSVAAALGLTPSQVTRDPMVANLIANGASLAQIIDYFRSKN